MTSRKDNNPLFTIPTSTCKSADTGGSTIPSSALETNEPMQGPLAIDELSMSVLIIA